MVQIRFTSDMYKAVLNYYNVDIRNALGISIPVQRAYKNIQTSFEKKDDFDTVEAEVVKFDEDQFHKKIKQNLKKHHQ